MEAQGRGNTIILLGDDRSGWKKFVELLHQTLRKNRKMIKKTSK